MQQQLETLIQTRKFTLKVIEHCTIKQLNKIPKGFKNNIAWNLAHLVVTQQLLCYKLSGLTCLTSEEMIENFQKGTAPTYIISEAEYELIIKQFIEFPNQLKEDYFKGIFKNYYEYETSVNITLKNIEDGIFFNSFHEGIHLGVILQLLKFI